MASVSYVCKSCLRAARTVSTRSSQLTGATSSSYRAASTSSRLRRLESLAPATRYLNKSPVGQSLPTVPQPQTALRRRLATAAPAPSTSNPAPSEPQPARAILNPRTTDDGQPMRIFFGPRAANRLSTIATNDKKPNLALRVTVESGGCHGFQYLMSLTDLEHEPAAEDDTVFEGDKGAKVVIDESSLELLNGSTVDYTMELIGSQFKITGIPGASSSCGCGTSFDIKL